MSDTEDQQREIHEGLERNSRAVDPVAQPSEALQPAERPESVIVDKLPKAEAARLARITAVAATLPNHLKAAGVEAAEKKLMVAIGAYVDAVTVYSDALGVAWTELMRCEPLPAGFAAKVGNGKVRLNGVNYPQLDAQGESSRSLERQSLRSPRGRRCDSPRIGEGRARCHKAASDGSSGAPRRGVASADRG